MNSSTLLRRAIRWNLMLVLSIGIYGVLNDEDYWNAIGHGPHLYDYLYWCASALNGPSGFAAESLSRLVIEDSRIRPFVVQHLTQWQFALEYILWLVLIWPQWKAYDAVVFWCIGRRNRQTDLYAAIAAATVAGCILSYGAWVDAHQYSDIPYIQIYFWFFRIGSLTFAGPVILAYDQIRRRCYAPIVGTPDAARLRSASADC
jgi:hypothetical protein